MTFKHETTMPLNGYDLPAVAEYEIHPEDGVTVISVTLSSREIGPMFSPQGAYLGMGRQTLEVTKILSKDEIRQIADEIDTALTDAAAETRADSEAWDAAF